MKSFDFGISDDLMFAPVTGEIKASAVYRDLPDEIKSQFSYFDESGMQHGSHPAKTQPKKPDWLG